MTALTHGCHVDLEEGNSPDGCVIDQNRRQDCLYARKHERKEQCGYWRPIAVPEAPQSVTTAAARDVLAERHRQVARENWTPEDDDCRRNDEIAAFAALYAMPPAARDWPATETGYGDTFGAALCPEDWSPKFGGRRRDLVKAGALILAEIERLDRAATAGAQP